MWQRPNVGERQKEIAVTCAITSWILVLISVMYINSFKYTNFCYCISYCFYVRIIRSTTGFVCVCVCVDIYIRCTTWINKDLYTMNFKALHDILNVIFCTLSLTFKNCSTDVVKWICSEKYQKAGDSRGIPTRLSICLVIVNAILIRNRLQHIWKGMVGCEEHNWILGIRIVFREPVTSAVMHYLCCYHWRPKEANIFIVIPMASGRGSTLKL